MTDRPVDPTGREVHTTDRDGNAPAYYKFSIEGVPLTFFTFDAAEYIIYRFQIPNAKPMKWND